jgi:dUTP pyrophosphatase
MEFVEVKKLKVVKLNEKASLPKRSQDGDAGYDLSSSGYYEILPGERVLIKTGLKMKIPDGLYGRIAPRSSLAVKNGIDVLGGVVDSNYTGEVCVILLNTQKEIKQLDLFAPSSVPGVFVVKPGDRIAQIIFENYSILDVEEALELEGTNRGEKGFGSTGV